MSENEVGQLSKQLNDVRNEVREGFAEVSRRLGTGDTTFATLQLRLRIIESIVYGGVSIFLIAGAERILGMIWGS